jgi:hypothetical protein
VVADENQPRVMRVRGPLMLSILPTIKKKKLVTIGGIKRRPHTDTKVQNGYMIALDKMVFDDVEHGLI